MTKSKPNVQNTRSEQRARRGHSFTVRTVEGFVAQSITHCQQPTQRSEHVPRALLTGAASLALCVYAKHMSFAKWRAVLKFVWALCDLE